LPKAWFAFRGRTMSSPPRDEASARAQRKGVPDIPFLPRETQNNSRAQASYFSFQNAPMRLSRGQGLIVFGPEAEKICLFIRTECGKTPKLCIARVSLSQRPDP